MVCRKGRFASFSGKTDDIIYFSEDFMITDGNEIKLFAGNSNLALAKDIAKELHTEVGGIEVG